MRSKNFWLVTTAVGWGVEQHYGPFLTGCNKWFDSVLL